MKINKEKINICFQDWGNISFKEGWRKQKDLFEEIVAQKIKNRDSKQCIPTKNYLIFCEHPHVFTLGRSGKMSHLLVDDKTLKKIDTTFVQIDRGGDITYHGPGQLVGYLIFDIENFGSDIGKFLRNIEQSIINTLEAYKITASRIKGLTGVWIKGKTVGEDRKIASIGIRCSRWVSMHGFAFNINTDLSKFNYIVPCGIGGKKVTSLAVELKSNIDLDRVKRLTKKNIIEIFASKKS